MCIFSGWRHFKCADGLPTIQSAINAAADGDTVLVAAGTYYENLTWESKSIALIGTGTGDTIVDGGGNGSCLVMQNVPETARVEGFAFTNGSATHGGGLHLGYSSPTLTNNVIEGNEATSCGGGLYLYRSSPTLTDNGITHNSVGSTGGGLICVRVLWDADQ